MYKEILNTILKYLHGLLNVEYIKGQEGLRRIYIIYKGACVKLCWNGWIRKVGYILIMRGSWAG